MRVLVPFDAVDPKTRLSAVLSPDERRAFARASLKDVLAALDAIGHDPEVLTTDSLDIDSPVIVDDRPLTPAINDRLATSDEPVAVVMADLAIVTAAALDRLFSADGDVVIAPGRNGGTNALVARHAGFRVDYHGASIRDHRAAARRVDADVTEIDSFRLAIDIDEPDDLVEVLLHGDGRAAAWLREHGFELATDDRVRAVRR